MAGRKYTKKTTVKKYAKKSSVKKTSGMGADLARLKRQVARLTKVAINKIQYQNVGTLSMSTATGTSPSYDARALFKFSNWTRVFGADADDEVNKNCLIRNCTGRLWMSTNEPSGRNYSAWVVSLKDNASELLGSGTGDLNALVSGTHYIGTDANVLLNLKFFKVHYHRARHAGIVSAYQNQVGGGTGIPGVQTIPAVGEDMSQLMRFRINLGKGIRVSNPSGDWKAGIYPKDPSQNYYLIVFSSADSNTDLEYPQMYFNTLTTVEVSG